MYWTVQKLVNEQLHVQKIQGIKIELSSSMNKDKTTERELVILVCGCTFEPEP